MKPEALLPSGETTDEISALVELLVGAEQRLEELTGGEVDSVTGKDGRTILLGRAQEQLRNNDAEKRSAILNALPANIVLIDARGIIISINDGWRQFAEANGLVAPEHGIGSDYLAVCDRAVGPEANGARQIAAGLRSVLGGDERSFSWEYPCHSPTDQRWYLLTATPLSGDRRNGVVVAHFDVTARKLSESTVADSELKFRTLFEYAPDGIIIANADNYYLDANASICNMLGYTHQELIGRHASDIVAEAERKYIRPTMDSITADTDHNGVWQFRRRDGSVFFGDVLITRIPDGNLMAMIRDISEQERAKREKNELNQQIETERSRLKNIVASVPGVVWEAWGQPDSSDQRIDFVSDYVETLLGYTPEEWTATPNFWLSIVHPDDLGSAAWASAAALVGDSVDSLRQFRWRKKSGEYIWVEAKSVPVLDVEGVPVGMRGVTVDISVRKRAEDERRIIAEIMQGVISTPSLDDFLELVHRSIGKLIYAENCYVMLHDPVADTISFDFWVDKRDPRPEPKLRGNGFASYVLSTGKPLLMTPEDKQELVAQGKARFIGSSSASWIGVPLRTPVETFGVLVLQHYELENVYTDRDLDFLTSVGDQVALAIARNRADLELIAAEEKYRLLFENATDGIFQITHDGRLLSANPALARIMGFSSPAEMIRERTDFANQGYVHPSQREEFKRIIAEQGFLNGYEVEVRRKDGATIWISENVRIVRDEAGRELYYEGSLRDVTERKTAQEELVKSEERYRELVENAHDIIYTHDLEGNFTSVNKAGEKFSGYPREELLKRGMEHAIAPEFLQKARSMIAAKLAGQEETAYELELIAKDGSRVGLEVNTRIIYEKGIPVGVQGIGRDITERKKSEAALRKSEELYRDAVENAIDIIYTHDLRGNYTAVNQAVERITGYSRAEALSMNMAEIVSPSDRPRGIAMATALVAGEGGQAMELDLIAKDGRVITVDINSRVVVENGKMVGIQGIARDITERKRAEAALKLASDALAISEREQRKLSTALQEEQKRLVEAQALAKLGSWHTDLWTTEVIWSEETHRIFDHDPNESDIYHSTFLSFVHPEDRAFVDKAFVDSQATTGHHSLEHRVLLESGEIKFVEERWQIIHDAEGRALRAIGTVIDITERKRANASLLESEARYRTLFETSPDGVAMFDLQMNVLVANAQAALIFGYKDADEMIGKNAFELVAPEVQARAKLNMGRLFASGYLNVFESIALRADGARFPAEFSATLIRNLKDKPVAVLGVTRDITERTLSAQKLRSSEETLAKSQEIAHLGSWDMSIPESGNVNDTQLRWSDEVFRILGYEPRQIEVNNDTFFAAVHPDDRASVSAAMAKALLEGSDYKMDFRIIRPDGSERFVHEHSEIVRHAETGRPISMVGTIQDITVERELSEQLRQSQKMEAVGVLAGGIAHDFNNLLTAINGYSALTLKRMAPDDPFRHYIEEVKNAGDRAAELTSQLLAFSRKQVLQPAVVNLNTVIANIQKMLRRMIRENIELRVVLDPELCNIKADPGQIEQVIMNLAINARDAMPNGGTLTVETSNVHLDENYVGHHVAITPGDFVRITVTDTGEGMDAATLSHIFEPFFTTKEVGKGTGLGLSTVYGIVKQSGGDAIVSSEPGHGATFTIYLPSVVDTLPGSRWEDEDERSNAGTETILLVEDEAIVRTFVSTILNGNGYTVLEAANGDDALKISRTYAGKIDLLLTDLIMPKMNGTELKERLINSRPDTRSLYMSGYTDDSISQHGILNSETAFIEKPFTPDSLSRKIREVLDA